MLTHPQQQFLCQTISNIEIKEALDSIDDNKAPSIDGFNAFFLKKIILEVIKEDLKAAIMEFFNEGKMLLAVNNTSVTLVPKCEKPENIKQYRPIACCTVFYKFISKILTRRIREVIDDLVGPSQSAFVPGRIISDNPPKP